LLGALALATAAGCSGSSGSSAPPSTTGVTAPSANQVQIYLNSIHHDVPQIASLKTDGTLTLVGLSVCKGLANGLSPFQAQEALINADTLSQVNQDDMAKLVGLAIVSFCPKYTSQLSDVPQLQNAPPG
jgi:hypothetical protein